MNCRSLVLLSALGLAGCGTVPGVNSDVPNAFYAGAERPTPQSSDSVQTVDTPPLEAGETMQVSGVSCKNKVWDPAPSRENAIALMKNQAAENGFNAVYDVDVAPDARALAMNCWSAIRARGVAFNVADGSI